MINSIGKKISKFSYFIMKFIKNLFAEIRGNIKMQIQKVVNEKYNSTYGLGSITNGFKKMELRMTSFENVDKSIHEGDPIEAIGVVHMNSHGQYFLKIENSSSIKLILGKRMSVNDLIKITSIVSKKKVN